MLILTIIRLIAALSWVSLVAIFDMKNPEVLGAAGHWVLAIGGGILSWVLSAKTQTR